MPAPLSIIIPTLNAETALQGLLQDLVSGLEMGLIRDLIISDAGSSDGTKSIAEDVGAQFVTSQRGRGTQLGQGAVASRGDWLLFLHADSRLEGNWSQAVAAHISASTDPAYFRLAFASRHPLARLTAAWANTRSRLFSLPYGDQGLLLPREIYEDVGGFDPVPLMEDVAMARKLPRLEALPSTIVTSADRYQHNGWLRQGSSNLVTLGRYLLGADPGALAARYNRR